MNPIPTDNWHGAPQTLRRHYEVQVLSTLALLWQRKRLVSVFGLVALAFGALVAFVIDKRYTAEAIVEPKLARENPLPPIAGTAPPQAVALDASSLIETEVRLIRSRGIAQRVARHLNLMSDPTIAPRGVSGAEAEHMIVSTLMRRLRVTNDSRSYLIYVAFSSNSPALSAKIANAYAEEYLRARGEAAARREVSALSAIYGAKHPALASAQMKLDELSKRLPRSDSAQVVVRAEPPQNPSGPGSLLIVSITGFAGIAAGIMAVLLRDRANAGFRTDTELVAEIGAPCLAVFPEATDPIHTIATADCAEAARAVAASTGLFAASSGSNTVLIASSVPGEGKSLIGALLANACIDMNRRVLMLDMSPGRGRKALGTSLGLEEILEAIECGSQFPLNGQRDHTITLLRRSSGIDAAQQLVTSAAFSKLLEDARAHYDLIVIEAPPIMLSADGLYLGRFADVVLHVVRWRETRRSTVTAAVRRMRNAGLRIDGALLSRVEYDEYVRFSGADPRHYSRELHMRRALPFRDSAGDMNRPAA
jgi:Mrp family chromosome partitioning ATPase